MSYYYGENVVLLPPFHIITATGLSDGVFHGEIFGSKLIHMASDSVYVCGTHILNRAHQPFLK
ncbi:hypothetical protein AUQ43_00340 [Thalassospira sp. MCCC 1A01148]|jgi:hypothetical protein|uniref:Uncharacterized protein n=1 Tax=Thalassospira profundimaris TaxID=502049 RepID=A0A367VI51_9PROT|nr:hypothetical protein AUQ43_00340 [Thalassospira sp. MCCC 1A01148]MBS8275365.1 hypothetical protein [Thalassospira tepidiphila]RCK23920.1 hypothetical protein TH6_04150 [Thalassospira profundimaris]HCK16915.1 hypothetical protein [Thalassospira sp.]|tara:strand:+ start:238 stop:426 length:189 start_codon:yes stop_codon:yes gene_type:complete